MLFTHAVKIAVIVGILNVSAPYHFKQEVSHLLLCNNGNTADTFATATEVL